LGRGEEREVRGRTHIWVLSLRLGKMGIWYGYSVGGHFSHVRDAFWVWVTI
jgi:hypothetical protein